MGEEIPFSYGGVALLLKFFSLADVGGLKKSLAGGIPLGTRGYSKE